VKKVERMKPKRMRVSFDESDPLYHLKKQRVDVVFNIMKSKTKQQEDVLQIELSRINKLIRGK